jgi:hypothetical protein
MATNFNFLSMELRKELTDLFGRGVNTKRILSYWNQVIKASGKQAKEIEEHGLTPGKYREGSGDIGVNKAPEWDDVQTTRLLDGEELKSKEFYQGVISASLLRHKQANGEGWENHYKSPIAYCVSQLEKLAFFK